MQLKLEAKKLYRAYTLVEVLVAFIIVGVGAAALLAGLLWITTSTRMARETMRASQIMEEKLDTLRLCSWRQLNSNGYIQTNFTAPFAPSNSATWITYTGNITIANAPFTEMYSSRMRQVTVSLKWPSGARIRSSQMTTLVAEYGMQTYIY